MNTNVTNKPVGSETANLVEQAADGAHSALRSTQSVANAAFDRLSDKVDSARDQAVPLINRLSNQAELAARRSVEAVRDTSAQLREKALRASDTTVNYIKDEPVKAVLIAAVTGAALMGIFSFMGRSRRRD